jgi:hypothetical protein
MKSSGELCNEMDRYAAAFTVAAHVFELEEIDLVWSNDPHRVSKLDSFIARDAQLLGNVGVTINPQYHVLAEADGASAEGFLKGIATVIQLEATVKSKSQNQATRISLHRPHRLQKRQWREELVKVGK